MERTGNTIGKEGRRQGDTDPDRRNDKPRQQERLADREIEEQRREAGERAPAPADPRSDRVEQDPAGTKPGTRSTLEHSDVDAER